jgi:uncharacterized RDD family membrane protein YckC
VEPTTNGIVTPEAVVLEFETAGIGSRTIAKLIDLAVMLVLLFGVLFVLGVVVAAAPVLGEQDYLLVIFVTVLLAVVLFGYPAGMEALWDGRTLGKAALGLRVVTQEGAPVRFRHAMVRSLVGFVELFVFVGSIAYVAMLATRDSRRLGDLAAGTVVLRARHGGRRAVAVTFPAPPGLEQYVRTLDVSTLSVADYGLVRSFLTRVFELDLEARWSLANRLAGTVAAALRHTPPAGMHPEVFLVCVATAYQRRHSVGPPPSPAWGAPPPPGSWGAAPRPPAWGAPPPPGSWGAAPPPAWGAPAAHRPYP